MIRKALRMLLSGSRPPLPDQSAGELPPEMGQPEPQSRAGQSPMPGPAPGPMPSPVPSVVPTGWPIEPPFDFNSPTISRFSPEVTGRTLLSDMCARLGWSSLAGRRVLDYGCGVRFVRTIVNLEMEIGHYAGVDLNADAIAWLQANVRDPRLRFERLDMRNPMYNRAGGAVDAGALAGLGLADFDVACMFSVITHQDPANAAMIFAMLRPCARRLYFTAFIDDSIDGYLDQNPANPCHYCIYSTELLTRLLVQNGWRIEATFPPGRFQQTAFLCG